jgi:hypothetical protein
MTLLTPARARAYVNFGRWVSDCPQECGCALQLEPGQMLFPCPECKVISEVEWPDNADAIWEALAKRPAPKTRNWYPAGHDLAVRFGIAHGQTVKELDDETYDHIGQRP